MKHWISKANWKRLNPNWPGIGDREEIHQTYDLHDDKDQAEHVCFLLLTDYSKDTPCPIRGVCVEAWVEENK